MSDLFHEEVADQYITSAFEVMAATNWHTHQVLTKRPARMREMLKTDLKLAARLPHIWRGVSVENRKHGLPRVDCLQKCDVAMRFLSCEPLLENLGSISLNGIGWVIAGGGSGPGARPMQRDWVASLRDQCQAANVPFFFKQWGGFPKGEFGSELDGKKHKAFPPMPQLGIPSLSQRRSLEAGLKKRFQGVGVFEQAA